MEQTTLLRSDLLGKLIDEILVHDINYESKTDSLKKAVEDRLRLVAVFLDLSLDAVVTAGAVRIIAAPQDIIVMQDPAAGFTAAVMIVIAAGAECRMIVTDCIVRPDSFAAVVAFDSVVLCAIITEPFLVDLGLFVLLQDAAAHRTDSLVFHFVFLHKIESPRRLAGLQYSSAKSMVL